MWLAFLYRNVRAIGCGNIIQSLERAMIKQVRDEINAFADRVSLNTSGRLWLQIRLDLQHNVCTQTKLDHLVVKKEAFQIMLLNHDIQGSAAIPPLVALNNENLSFCRDFRNNLIVFKRFVRCVEGEFASESEMLSTNAKRGLFKGLIKAYSEAVVVYRFFTNHNDFCDLDSMDKRDHFTQSYAPSDHVHNQSAQSDFVALAMGKPKARLAAWYFLSKHVDGMAIGSITKENIHEFEQFAKSYGRSYAGISFKTMQVGRKLAESIILIKDQEVRNRTIVAIEVPKKMGAA